MNAPYTSRELSHFVGFKHPQDHEENYQKLLTVLDSGWISYGPDFPRRREFARTTVWDKEHIFDGKPTIRQTTCYAAIPSVALGTHLDKYGEFGISFPRDYLIKNGARPVMYVPLLPSDRLSGWGSIYTEVMVEDWIETWYGFEEHVAAPVRSSEFVHKMKVKPPNKNDAISAASSIISHEFFAFLKVFNADLSDTHIDNFLMEQEWRILNALPFSVNEICCVYANQGYLERLASDRPHFAGKIKSPRI